MDPNPQNQPPQVISPDVPPLPTPIPQQPAPVVLPMQQTVQPTVISPTAPVAPIQVPIPAPIASNPLQPSPTVLPQPTMRQFSQPPVGVTSPNTSPRRSKLIKLAMAVVLLIVVASLVFVGLRLTILSDKRQVVKAANGLIKAIETQDVKLARKIAPSQASGESDSQLKSDLKLLGGQYTSTITEYASVAGTSDKQARGVVFYHATYKDGGQKTYLILFVQKLKGTWQVVDFVPTDNNPRLKLSDYNNSYFTIAGGDGSAGDGFSSSGGTGTAANSTTQANETDQANAYALQTQLENYFNTSTYYPATSQVTDDSWIATIGGGTTKADLQSAIVDHDNKHVNTAGSALTYTALPAGCSGTTCQHYTVTAKQSGAADLTLQSLN